MLAFCRVLMILLFSNTCLLAQDFGFFTGELKFEWKRNGRDMVLLVPFGYKDPAGLVWNVPPGAVTDGASIPRILWSIIGGPFEGNYRDAAVIHDYYCEVKARTWRETHLVFYNAMRAAGVSEVQAKIMYAGVYYFGPRWGIGSNSRGPGATGQSTEQQKQFITKLEEWIKREEPDVAEISNRLDLPNPDIP